MGVKLNGIRINREILKNSADYGAPSMFQQMAMYACTALVAPLTNTCATAALSGYAIANKARRIIPSHKTIEPSYPNNNNTKLTAIINGISAFMVDFATAIGVLLCFSAIVVFINIGFVRVQFIRMNVAVNQYMIMLASSCNFTIIVKLKESTCIIFTYVLSIFC